MLVFVKIQACLCSPSSGLHRCCTSVAHTPESQWNDHKASQVQAPSCPRPGRLSKWTYITSCCNMCCDTEFLRPSYVLDASDLTFVFVRKNGLAIVSDLTLKQTCFAFPLLSFWSSLLRNNPELVRRVIITTTTNYHSHCSFMWIRISSALVNQKQIEKQTGLWGLCKMKPLLSISF